MRKSVEVIQNKLSLLGIGPDDGEFSCNLSARITQEKCYLYLMSRAPSCCDCLRKLGRVRGGGFGRCVQ